MSKTWSAAGLLALAAFMAMGLMKADLAGKPGAAIFAATFVVVVLPAAFGFKLLYDHFQGDQRVAQNKADLRQKTREAEMLKLAQAHGGKLTIVEVVTAMAITPEEAKDSLDNLARRGMADFQVTDAGVVVYDFVELRRIGDKSTARNILDD